MTNKRGMYAGLGEGIAQVGQIGLQDALAQAKEKRIQKLQLEAESRAESRDLAKEERAGRAAVAAEQRAADREAAGDGRKHRNRLAELEKAAELDKDKAKFEQDLKSGAPKHKVITTDGSLTEPGGVYIYDETNPENIRRLNQGDNTLEPVGVSKDMAPSAIPPEIEALARAKARKRVDDMAGYASSDASDFSEYGVDRKAAEGVFYREEMSKALSESGLDPKRYGFQPAEEGLVSLATKHAAAGPTIAQKDTSAPLPGDIGNTGAQWTPPTSSGDGGLPPAAAQALANRLNGRPDGTPVRFKNGQVWTLVKGAPKRLE